eukprot:scaffold3036_cov414-Prasinococcus_capsulatus_cf.AAC.29
MDPSKGPNTNSDCRQDNDDKPRGERVNGIVQDSGTITTSGDGEERRSSSPTTGQSPGQMCSVCLEEYQDGDQLICLPTCGHRFHKQYANDSLLDRCLAGWVATSATCPYCRNSLLLPESQQNANRDIHLDAGANMNEGAGVAQTRGSTTPLAVIVDSSEALPEETPGGALPRGD